MWDSSAAGYTLRRSGGPCGCQLRRVVEWLTLLVAQPQLPEAPDDHKEGRALRTETVINDTYDFDVGRRLKNLDDLKQSLDSAPPRSSR